jgi:ketosteroid isomerase-like protein
MTRLPKLSSRAELKREVRTLHRSRRTSCFLRQGYSILCAPFARTAGIFILLCATALAQQGTKPNPTPNSCLFTDDAAIRHLAEQFRDAYNRGDAAEVASLYTDNAYYLTQHFATGIVEGRKSIQAYVQRGVDAHYHLDSIEVLKVNCGCATPTPSLKARLRGAQPTRKCDFAYAIARYKSTNDGQKAMGVNLIVLRKFQNDWRIVAHESAVPDSATAIKKLD